MKKQIKLVLEIFILFIALQTIIFVFKKEHTVKYDITNNKEKFAITEKYLNNKYYIKISNGKHNFSYIVDNHYFKDKKIVDDILFTKEDDNLCIFPLLKKDTLNITCSDKKNTYSYTSKEDEGSKLVKTLKDKKYKLNSWYDTDKNTKDLGKIKIYQDNLIDNTYLYIWKYNGFYSINNKDLNKIDIFKNDTYVNDLGIVINKYYMIPDYDSKYQFNKIYVYNMKNNKKKVIKSKYDISTDSYINGIVNNKLYLFDKDNLIQYEINPKKRKIKVVGNRDKGGLTYNGKFENISIYDLKDRDIKFFTEDNYLKEVEDVTTLKYIHKNDNIYYYLDSNNNLYRYDTITKVKVLLFNEKDISFITGIKDDIYFVKDNTLYVYNLNDGIKKILVYEELSFNIKNRIGIYKEK